MKDVVLMGRDAKTIKRVIKRMFDGTEMSYDERRDLAEALQLALDNAITLCWECFGRGCHKCE